MKILLKILKILVICVLIAVIPVLIFVRPKDDGEMTGLVFDKNEMPTQYETTSAMASIDPYNLPTSDEGKIELAALLYDIANANTKSLENCAFWVDYNSTINISFTGTSISSLVGRDLICALNAS